jgi:Co/Zn/Cd efflux system component
MDDKSQKRLFLSLLVTVAILVAEVIGGIISHSLALLSDAGRVLTDAFALGLSLIALLINFFLVCETVQRYDTFDSRVLFRDDEFTSVHFGRMKALDD